MILAEYGAFEILGYQTFTTEIFAEFQVSFNVQAACASALVVGALECRGALRRVCRRGHGRVARTGSPSRSAPSSPRVGTGQVPGARRLRALVVLALGVPDRLEHLLDVRGRHRRVRRASRSWPRDCTPRSTAASRPLLATLMALPVALLAVRHPSRRVRPARAQHVSGAGHAGPRGRPRPELFLRTLRGLLRLPDALRW